MLQGVVPAIDNQLREKISEAQKSGSFLYAGSMDTYRDISLMVPHSRAARAADSLAGPFCAESRAITGRNRDSPYRRTKNEKTVLKQVSWFQLCYI
jgi:hypothetical protein